MEAPGLRMHATVPRHAKVPGRGHLHGHGHHHRDMCSGRKHADNTSSTTLQVQAWAHGRFQGVTMEGPRAHEVRSQVMGTTLELERRLAQSKLNCLHRAQAHQLKPRLTN